MSGSRGEDTDLLSRLAERIGGQARASAVFGEPIERGEVTVIPVARAGWGFGAGSKRAEEGQTGGGGGGMVAPLGYIEVRSTGVRFRPVWGATTVVLAASAVALAALVLGRHR